jgi:hypothetical protein
MSMGDTFLGNTVQLVLADGENIGVYQNVTGASSLPTQVNCRVMQQIQFI